MRRTTVDRLHPWHVLARQKSTLEQDYKRRSIIVVAVVCAVSLVDIVDSASAIIAAALSLLVIILLLCPEPLRRVPQLMQYEHWRGSHSALSAFAASSVFIDAVVWVCLLYVD